jgi:hypothetical protein
MRIAVIVLLRTALLGGVWAYRQERNDRQEDVARLEGELSSVRHDLAGARRANAVLAERLRGVSRKALKAKLARTELAARVRRSVFTVTASLDEGNGWVGWVKGRNSYVVTANHVVVFSVARGDYGVRVHEGKRSWRGRIVKTDEGTTLR